MKDQLQIVDMTQYSLGFEANREHVVFLVHVYTEPEQKNALAFIHLHGDDLIDYRPILVAPAWIIASLRENIAREIASRKPLDVDAVWRIVLEAMNPQVDGPVGGTKEPKQPEPTKQPKAQRIVTTDHWKRKMQ